MDVDRLDRLNRKNKVKQVTLLVISLLVLTALIWLYNRTDEINRFNLDDLWIEQVQRGDLTISAKAVGKLKTANKYLITSQVSGTVTAIEKNVGSLVKQDELILTLESETLKQQAKESEYALNQAKASHQILVSDLDVQSLNNESNLFKLENKLEIQKLKLARKESLAKKGIISEMDILEARMAVNNIEKELSFENKKAKSFEKSKSSKLAADLLIIEELEQKLQNELKLLSGLQIKGSFDGVINKVNVAFGEHVSIGQSLVELNDNSKLNAVVQVNESFGSQIKYGQEVKVDVLNSIVRAHIKSINPEIKNNSIELELSFDETLPEGVRADMNVTADIIFSQIKDTLWVTKPQGVTKETVNKVFVYDEFEQSAVKKEVFFGKEGNNKIQVINGLALGESVLINQVGNIDQNSVEIEVYQ